MGVIEFTEEELAFTLPKIRGLDVETEARRIARAHGTSWEAMRSPLRFKHIVSARRALYLLLREHGWSYPAIANLVNRDHTSVMHIVKCGTPHGEATRLRKKLAAGGGHG